MAGLSAASNLLAPAYYLLVEQGFSVRYESAQSWWIAEKDDIRLLAYDPIELCGLAFIQEKKGEEWAASDEAIEAFLKLEQ